MVSIKFNYRHCSYRPKSTSHHGQLLLQDSSNLAALQEQKICCHSNSIIAVTMGEFPSLSFSTIWGLFRASLLQPVSKEKDGESKRWKQISWGILLSWISPYLMLFWKPQLLLSVDYKDQIPFFLKKKKKKLLLSLTITEKGHKKHDWSAPAGLQGGGKGKELRNYFSDNHILSKTQGFGRTFDCKQASTKNETKCKSHA